MPSTPAPAISRQGGASEDPPCFARSQGNATAITATVLNTPARYQNMANSIAPLDITRGRRPQLNLNQGNPSLIFSYGMSS
jgi:hypothetical protein